MRAPFRFADSIFSIGCSAIVHFTPQGAYPSVRPQPTMPVRLQPWVELARSTRSVARPVSFVARAKPSARGLDADARPPAGGWHAPGDTSRRAGPAEGRRLARHRERHRAVPDPGKAAGVRSRGEPDRHAARARGRPQVGCHAPGDTSRRAGPGEAAGVPVARRGAVSMPPSARPPEAEWHIAGSMPVRALP
jgi:hypothetical protein